MPAFWQACLMIAWVFWRGALIDVWNTNFSLVSPFARTPSEPRFQPAASSTLFAFSTLNSQRVFFELKRWGLFRKFAVARPVRP
jgi:hypothetical protein